MIAVISDIHDNLANLDKVIKYCQEQKITTMICCGDVTNSETLKYLAKKFPGTIWLALGNMELFDEEEVEQYKNIHCLGRTGGYFQYKDKSIGLCHEPSLVDGLLERQPQIDIVFYGHTHRPWQDQKDLIKLVNPGNVANTLYAPSFAIFDPKTNESQLKLLNEM